MELLLLECLVFALSRNVKVSFYFVGVIDHLSRSHDFETIEALVVHVKVFHVRLVGIDFYLLSECHLIDVVNEHLVASSIICFLVDTSHKV